MLRVIMEKRSMPICFTNEEYKKIEEFAKKQWNIEGFLCAECHMDKMRQFFEGTMTQNCVKCSVKKKITDLWEPRWQWEMEGLLCKDCFDKKEKDFTAKKEFCSMCG